MFRLSALVFLLLALNEASAQDPAFSQPFSVPLYYNPAYTGSKGSARVQAAHRIQWPNVPGNSSPSYLAFDLSPERLPFDVGITQLYDRISEGRLETYIAGLNLARSFRIKNEVAIRLGIAAAYAMRRLDWSRLTFGDQMDSRYDFIYYEVSGNYPFATSRFLLLNAGAIVHGKYFLLGYSACNLNTPNQSFFSGGMSRLPLRHTAQGVLRIPLPFSEGSTDLSLIMLYMRQSSFSLQIPGLGFCHRWLKLGLYYRKKDAYIGMAGYAGKKLSLAYSYDHTVSVLTNATGGAHELNLGWCFGKKNEKRPAIDWLNRLF